MFGKKWLGDRDDPEKRDIPIDRAERALQNPLICFSPTLDLERRDDKNFVEDRFSGGMGHGHLQCHDIFPSEVDVNRRNIVPACRPAHDDRFDAKISKVSLGFQGDTMETRISPFLSKIGRIGKNHEKPRKNEFFRDKSTKWSSAITEREKLIPDSDSS